MKWFLLFVHRWLGVAMCVLFFVWFCSGIGMIYWDFPTVTPAARLQRSAPLDRSTITVSPADALRAARGVDRPRDVRLNTFDGRPVYRFRIGGSETVVYADSGDVRAAATLELARRAAARWTQQPEHAATVTEVTEVDQWTVQSPLRALRPLWKFSWPDGQQVYVAGSSGEVVQYTTPATRLRAYLGPIPHWFYFTPLRKYQARWTAVVVWSSAVATVAALIGLVLGGSLYSPTRRYRPSGRSSAIPYTGQKRWHMALGLVFGTAAATWAFSGMLSMDPFPSRAVRPPVVTADLTAALRTPIDLDRVSRDSIAAALSALSDVRELELVSVAGRPALLATLANGATRVVADGSVREAFDIQWLAGVVRETLSDAGGADIRVVDRPDPYYMDRRNNRPLPALRVQQRDADRTRLYIDPKTARVVARYSERDWASRWLYHGLHSLEFPGLYDRRPLWDAVVIAFMLGGAGLSTTSIVLACRVVAKAVRQP